MIREIEELTKLLDVLNGSGCMNLQDKEMHLLYLKIFKEIHSSLSELDDNIAVLFYGESNNE